MNGESNWVWSRTRAARTAKCPMCGSDCENLYLRNGLVFGCDVCEDIKTVDAVEYLEDSISQTGKIARFIKRRRNLMNLYEIKIEIDQLIASMVDEETGEVNEDTLAALDALQMEKDEKLHNYVRYAKNEQAYAELIEAEMAQHRKAIEDLRSRANAKRNHAARLLQIVADEMGVGSKLEFADMRISVVKGAESADFAEEDVDRIADWLDAHDGGRAVSRRITINKTELKKLLKSGVDVPGASIKIGNPSVRVK